MPWPLLVLDLDGGFLGGFGLQELFHEVGRVSRQLLLRRRGRIRDLQHFASAIDLLSKRLGRLLQLIGLLPVRLFLLPALRRWPTPLLQGRRRTRSFQLSPFRFSAPPARSCRAVQQGFAIPARRCSGRRAEPCRRGWPLRRRRACGHRQFAAPASFACFPARPTAWPARPAARRMTQQHWRAQRFCNRRRRRSRRRRPIPPARRAARRSPAAAGRRARYHGVGLPSGSFAKRLRIARSR